jgi:hypothetical protein
MKISRVGPLAAILFLASGARPLHRGAPAPLVTVGGMEPQFGGTFIGAAIAEDGIVVASDSRSTFLDENGRSIGYIDGMPKIFVDGGAAVAVSGLTSIDRELFSAFIRRNSFLLSRTPDEILFGVLAWLPFRNSTNVVLLSAGFVQGQPMICGKPPIQSQSCTRSGFFTSKTSDSVRRWYSGLTRLPKAAEAAAVLRQAIQDYAAADSTVGGAVSLLHLRPNALPSWLENRPSDRGWTTICDLVGAYREGSVRIETIASKAELDRYLNGTCPR